MNISCQYIPTKNDDKRLTVSTTCWILLALASVLFVGTRIYGVLQVNEIEDEDTVGIVYEASVIRDLDASTYMDLTPDSQPVYPATIALVSIVTGDFESAGRVVSLLAAIAVAVAVILIATRLTNVWVGSLCVLILAMNPFLVRFSYSVLTEPLYSALVAWAAYLVIANIDKPRLVTGLVLGALGGIAFSLRFESILLFSLIPVFQLVYWTAVRSQSTWTERATYCVAYFAILTVLAAPQVWRVSEKMNTFTLNGRFLWTEILNRESSQSYQERLFGLDYASDKTNLDFLQENPEYAQDLNSGVPILQKAKRLLSKVILNSEHLNEQQIGKLVNIVVFAFSVIGFLALLISSQAAAGIALALFVLVGLIAPLTYRVDLAHIALIAPILTVSCGIGIATTANILSQRFSLGVVRRRLVEGVLLFACVAPYAQNLLQLYGQPDDANPWYDRHLIDGPVVFLSKMRNDSSEPLPVLAAHGYVAYFSGNDDKHAPWTDTDGLIKYMSANDFELLYYDEDIQSFPFAADIGTDAWEESFRTLFETVNAAGEQQKVFALRSNPFTNQQVVN